MYRDVLDFWFGELDADKWWAVDPDFDQQMAKRFGVLLDRASRGELYQWRRVPDGRLAEILLLDQFSRHIYRGTPKAYSQDGMALALAQEAVSHGADLALSPEPRQFLYMPYLHSESLDIHRVAERLFQRLPVEGAYENEKKHLHIIEMFGRFPNRNEALGRSSTQQEIEFLRIPDKEI